MGCGVRMLENDEYSAIVWLDEKERSTGPMDCCYGSEGALLSLVGSTSLSLSDLI